VRKTTISVVINSHRSGDFLRDAIESVLEQTRKPTQVIVADTAEDGAQRIIEGYAQRYTCVIPVFGRNRGQLATIASGLQVATGDHVCLLDGDDRYTADHLEKMEDWWNLFSEADLLYCRHGLFGEPALVDYLRTTERHEDAEWLGPINLARPYDWGKSTALAWCHPDHHAGGITSALSFRKDHLASLPLKELCDATQGRMMANADYVLLLAAALYGGRKVYVPSHTVEHRIHRQSLTGRHACGERGSLADQRRFCALARSWLCSRPEFGPDLFRSLEPEMLAVPEISPGHRQLYRQALLHEPSHLTAKRRISSLEQRLDSAKKEAADLRRKVDALEKSTIWRATAPLRCSLDKIRNARRRLFRRALKPLRFGPQIVAVDVTTIIRKDAGTGIQRVVRRIARDLATRAGREKRVVLIDYSDGIPRDVTGAFLGATARRGNDTVDRMEMLVLLDSSYNLAPSFSRVLREAKRSGISIISVCHDILPVTNPEWFPAVNHIPFRRWLVLAREYSNAFLCVSDTTACRLSAHWSAQGVSPTPLVASWPLGHDLQSCDILPQPREPTCEPVALMVGTVEPRKNHIFVLEAMEHLRASGIAVPKLIVVGRYGWSSGKTRRLLRKAEAEGWAEWHDHGVSDEELTDWYARSSFVIQASLDEGFGLPVAEAAAMGKPVVLSDIPVFREIVSDHGYFFRLGDVKSFGEALKSACRPGAEPTITKAVSWRESADIFWQRCMELREATNSR